MYLLYVTFPSYDAAETIATALVKERLVACANIYSGVTSIYEWKGEIHKEQEVTGIFKIAKKKCDLAMEYISANHPNKCPCILAMDIAKGNKLFIDWVEKLECV